MEDDAEDYTIRSKRRKTKLLEDQLENVEEDPEERLEIQEDLDEEIEREKEFKEINLTV